MKIKLKDGFTCEANEKRVKDWRFARALAKCDSDKELEAIEGLSFIIPFLIGKDGEEALIKHLEDEDGIVTTPTMVKALKEIMSAIGTELKKSKSSQE